MYISIETYLIKNYCCSAYIIIFNNNSNAPPWLHALSTETFKTMIINHVQGAHNEYVYVLLNSDNVC